MKELLNVYTYRFAAKCPNNGRVIDYTWEIETQDTFMVETLIEYFKDLEPIFHEKLADQLKHAFGWRQTLTAHHHGVDIKTVRA